MTAASSRWMGLIAQLPCVVCTSLDQPSGRVEVHHIASGSGRRSDYSTAPLCYDHHRGPAGIHGIGTKAFLRTFRPPGESEYGLLVWTNEALEKLLWETGRKIAA